MAYGSDAGTATVPVLPVDQDSSLALFDIRVANMRRMGFSNSI
jgi:hypothetical protein